MEILDKFDRILYKGQNLTNILRKAIPIKRILDRIDVYHEYVIKEGERADTIAYDYYGSSTYTWLVYICNSIFDPYYEWPLTSTQLFDFLTKKYGNFYQTQVTIKHLVHPDKDYTISPYTYDRLSAPDKVGWQQVMIYDWEVEQNEKKRNIKLLSNRYLDIIDREINEMFD